jgi:hypothetical protein
MRGPSWRQRRAENDRTQHAAAMIIPRREDPELILSAMAYVEAIHKDVTAENTAPAPGVEGRVVSAILADPALSDYVRAWARENRAPVASVEPPPRRLSTRPMSEFASCCDGRRRAATRPTDSDRGAGSQYRSLPRYVAGRLVCRRAARRKQPGAASRPTVQERTPQLRLHQGAREMERRAKVR